jgi:hypothetical protein
MYDFQHPLQFPSKQCTPGDKSRTLSQGDLLKRILCPDLPLMITKGSDPDSREAMHSAGQRARLISVTRNDSLERPEKISPTNMTTSIYKHWRWRKKKKKKGRQGS